MAKQCIVVDTSRSPFAKLRPVPIDSVLMGDGLWGSRLRQIATVTLPSQYDQLERTGVVDNFRKAAGKIPGGFRGLVFNDTDAYKWIEAASLSLVHAPDPALKARVDSLIGIIAAAQDTDGYLDTYYSFGNRDKRWTELGTNHEMYCAGHLIQAAVAHARSTGESPLLDVARRLADHVDRTFGPGRRQGTPGHPEIEMALVELYRLTGEPRYLALAGFLVDQRGRFPLTGLPAEKLVNHLPVREMSDIAGHAVRALYLMSGVTDIMLETGEPALRAALERLWTSLVARRMHVTGSAGSRYEGETFGEDFELPNRRAYCETCAAIANVMWNWRMLLATGHGRHADVMELALLNGTLSGISLDGTNYFYVNPLADRGRHRRAPWIECACCIPNLSRTLLAIPGMLFTTSDDGIQVNLYATARAEIAVKEGRVAIEESTRYPWEGTVHFGVSTDVGEAFGLSFRVPAWAGSLAVSVNRKAIESRIRDGYATVRRSWKGQSDVTIRLPMKVRALSSHPHVLENLGRVAISRGPLVYCVESADNADFDPWDLAVTPGEPFTTLHRPDLLGGITVIEGRGRVNNHRDFGDELYRSRLGRTKRGALAKFRAIPYYAWANREAGPMIVWLPLSRG